MDHEPAGHCYVQFRTHERHKVNRRNGLQQHFDRNKLASLRRKRSPPRRHPAHDRPTGVAHFGEKRSSEGTVHTPDDGRTWQSLAPALHAISGAIGDVGDGLRLDDLNEPLRLLCAAAREKSLHAESVVIELKRAIDGSPLYDGQSLDKRAELRSRIISRAIQIYYSEITPTRDGAES